eukprot:2889376-Amphidinium_carterae.1
MLEPSSICVLVSLSGLLLLCAGLQQLVLGLVCAHCLRCFGCATWQVSQLESRKTTVERSELWFCKQNCTIGGIGQESCAEICNGSLANDGGSKSVT